MAKNARYNLHRYNTRQYNANGFGQTLFLLLAETLAVAMSIPKSELLSLADSPTFNPAKGFNEPLPIADWLRLRKSDVPHNWGP